MRSILKRAGVPKVPTAGKIDFHALRTTYITHVLDYVSNVKEAQALARHQSLALTMQRYAKTFDHRLSDVVERFGDTIFDTDRRICVEQQAVGACMGPQNQELVGASLS